MKILNEDGVEELSGLFKNYANEQIVELTEAEYNALTPAEKMNGAVYFIKESTT